MEFFWDVHGITWEGAFWAAVLTVAGIYLLGFLVLRGIKWVQREILARKVRNLLQEPKNKHLLEMIQRGKTEI